MNNTIHNHYENVLDAYKNEIFFTKTKEYKKDVQSYIIDLLNLQRDADDNSNDSSNLLVVDLGGGMGDFSLDLKKQLHSRYSFLCVDPSTELINEAKRNGIDSVIANAMEFSLLDYKYDLIFLKEMIHHIPIDSLTAVFQNIHRQLNPNGSLLIVTRPVETDFPFFNKVKEIWKTTQPPSSVFTSSLIESNFNTTVYEREYKVAMSKVHWYDFIRNKSFSEFSLCSDNELEEGILELEEKYKDANTLHFKDKLIFIVAQKK
jgi:SAM-dependent methyltransferase